ncbi:unnamed protein product [Heterobilharzia americana]|nr:unnamed protein product [Heterobilharzia americana]
MQYDRMVYPAFLPIRLLSDYPYPLECLTCYDNFLLVGTKQGLLLVYELTPKITSHHEFFIPSLSCLNGHLKEIPFKEEISSDPISPSPLPSFFTHVKITRTLGRKPITQLAAIAEFNILLALAEGRMSVYQLPNCQLITTVPNSKGASLFAYCMEYSKMSTVSSFNVSEDSMSDNNTNETNLNEYSKSNNLELRICVVVKRHLHFWRWEPKTREFIYPGGINDLITPSWPTELIISEVVRSLEFCGLSKLIIGHRGEYLLVNILTGEIQFISAPGRNQLPIVASLPHCLHLSNLDEVIQSSLPNRYHFNTSLSANLSISTEIAVHQSTSNITDSDNNSCSNDHQYYCPLLPGSCSFLGIGRDDSFTIVSPYHEFKSVFQIQWSNVPYQVHVFPPYIIGTMDNSLEIRVLHPNQLIQQLSISRVTAMCHSGGWLYASTAPVITTSHFTVDSANHQNHSNQSMHNNSGARGKNTSGNEIWLILSVNRLKFIQELVKQKEFELAICLAKTALYSGQNAIETPQITILYAIHLYHEKKFTEALNVFTEQSINPIHVLSLFPGMLSEQQLQNRIDYPCDVSIINSSQMVDAFEPLITYLLTWRRILKQQSNKIFFKQSIMLDSLTKEAEESQLSPRNEQQKSSTTVEFTCYSIKDISVMILSCTKLLELIDTSLLKCYLSTNTARIAPLLRQENLCILEESVKTLQEHKRYQELVMLYQSRGLHREALSILQQFSVIRMKQHGRTTTTTTDMSFNNKLSFNFTLEKMNRGLIEQLGHPKRIIHYFIQHLNACHIDLLIDYTKWHMLRYPTSWMRILSTWEAKLAVKCQNEFSGNRMSSDDNKEKQDQFITFCSNYRNQILHYMEQYAVHLIIPYLEMIIFIHWNNQNDNMDDDDYDEEEDDEAELEEEDGEVEEDNDMMEEHGDESEENTRGAINYDDDDSRSNDSANQSVGDDLLIGKDQSKSINIVGNHAELKQNLSKKPTEHKLNKSSPRSISGFKMSSFSQLSCTSLDSMQSGYMSPGKRSNRFKDMILNSLWPFPGRNDSKRKRLPNPTVNSLVKEDNSSTILYDQDSLPPIPKYPNYMDVCDIHTRYATALIRRAQSLQPANKPFAFKVSEEQPKTGGVARLRLRLLRFLLHSDTHYSSCRLLDKCPYDGFFEERALLLANLNKHEQAISLWVHLLDDWNRAVNHCVHVYQRSESFHDKTNQNDNDYTEIGNVYTDYGGVSEKSNYGVGSGTTGEKLSLSSSSYIHSSSISLANSPSLDNIVLNNKTDNFKNKETLIHHTNNNSDTDIFFVLMQICLQPAEPATLGIVLPSSSPSKFTPKTKKALEILHQFSTFIDPIKVIRIMPTVGISSVGDYLKNMFICQDSSLTQLVFLQNAAKAELIASCTDRIKATSSYISVLSSTRCRTCRRRIGNSAFVKQPTNDELEHYGCSIDLVHNAKSNNQINSYNR